MHALPISAPQFAEQARGVFVKKPATNKSSQRTANKRRAKRKKAKQLLASGMNAVVYCGSMGDWPMLSDEQRQQGVRQLVEAIQGDRLPQLVAEPPEIK